MIQTDFYHTIQKPATAEHKERNSRFIAFAYPVETADEAKEKLKALKKEHSKANHHCFAWRIGLDGNNFRVSDDGEPSGTAGRPILGQIDSKGLVNVMIIVVRYFGGTLLGVPGLIQAYKTTASLALQLTPVIQKPVLVKYNLSFDYTVMNEVMTIIKQNDVVIEKQDISMFCSMAIGISKQKEDRTVKLMQDIGNIEIKKLI